MSTDSSSRNLFVVLGLVALVCCLGASAAVWVGVRALSEDFGGDGVWTSATLPLPKNFALEATPAPLGARERQSGFQDPRWEVLLRYSAPAAQDVLTHNGFVLQHVPTRLTPDEREEIIHEWHSAPARAFSVDGPGNIERDGGMIELYRNVVWVELEDGSVVLYLEVFET